MLRKLYDWTIDLAQKPYAVWALFFYAVAEASFWPLPVELLLIPMIIAAPRRAWYLAAVAILGSLAGALLGYAIGRFLYDTIGLPVLTFYHLEARFEHFAALYNDYGVWATAIAAVTPIPFKLVTILSGSTQLPLLGFIIASALGRALRYGVIAALLYYFGAPIRDFIEKYLGWVFAGFVLLLIGGFFAIGLF